MTTKTFGLFEAFGIELEYMIVDRESLAVRPIADEVLVEDGQVVSDIDDGPVAWSNELASHVIELKVAQPATQLEGWGSRFQKSIEHVLERLAPHGATLLGGGMHPTMNPDTEFRRWAHESSEIYAAFDRIFDCRGHGWSNLQSVHLNLPFDGDDELGRLHAAIRVILPILPAICASSPIYDGRQQRALDSRLEVYKSNAKKVPEVSGQVIPEPAFTRAEYDEVIFQPLYRAIAPHDPEGTLQHEWLNARGAIARFDRDAIEIRVMDIQEHPAADLAIVTLVTEVLKRLVAEGWSSSEEQRAFETARLRRSFDRCVLDGEAAVLDDLELLRALGFSTTTSITAGELWRHLAEATDVRRVPLDVILDQGTLARRILTALDGDHRAPALHEVYRELSRCLVEGRSFTV